MTDITEMFSLLNRYTGEHTTERVSNTERLSALSEAVSRVKQITKSDLSNATYPVEFIPGVNYYKIDKQTFNVLAGANIRVSADDHTGAKDRAPITRSAADKISEEISVGAITNTYALDRYDGEMYLVLNIDAVSREREVNLYNDISNVSLSGDALNLDTDTNEAITTASLKFNIDFDGLTPTSSSSIESVLATPLDISDIRNTGSAVWSVWITEPDELDSVKLKLKTDDSNYILFTAVVPFNNNEFKSGWNRFVVNYANAIEVGTPTFTAINKWEVELNYSAGFLYNTIRVDDIYLANPTKLNFHYLSYSVGKDAAGAEIYKFSNETDVPYFAGQYENMKFPIARYAASYILFDLRRYDDATIQEREAKASLEEVMNLIPSSHTVETKSFRPHGVNFRRRKSFRTRIR